MLNATARIIATMFDLHRFMRRRMLMAQEPGALNLHQMFTLVIIAEHPKLTMTELAQSLRISLPSTTSLIERLVRMHFVQRHTDAKNRKLVCLKLSVLGQKMLRSKMEACQRDMHAIFSLLPKKDQTTFARILEHILHVLHKSESPSSTLS